MDGLLQGALTARRGRRAMTGELLARGPVALLPVLLFLGALIYLDSFKLVRVRLVARRDGGTARWPRASAIRSTPLRSTTLRSASECTRGTSRPGSRNR